MADYLDLVQPIVNDKNEATAYFEDYLFQIIQNLGGEGSSSIEDGLTTAEEAFGVTWLKGQVNQIAKRVEQLEGATQQRADTRLLKRVEQLEGDLTHYKTAHEVAQLQIDTAGYVSLTKSSSYTAKHNEWIEATSKALITLPSNPLKNHRVRLTISDSSGVKILSTTNNIKVRGKLQNSILFRIAGESFDFHYFGDYWLVT